MGDTPDEAEASENQVAHSPLVGFMSVPVHRRLPIRRSTLLMAVAFVGFGTLLYFNPPDNTPAATGQVLHTPSGDFLVPGAIKVTTTTTTTTSPTTTTTTAPAVTIVPTTKTSRATGSATTRPVVAPTTTTTTTTTIGAASTTTSPARTGVGAGTSTTSAP